MLIFPHYQTMFLSLHVITDRCRLRGVEGRKGVVLLLDEKGIDEVKSQSFFDFHNKRRWWKGNGEGVG